MTSQVHIILAVYRPEPAHLTAQLRSLAEQKGCRVTITAVIADTQSGPLLADQAAELGLEITQVVPEQELDAVRAFEAGLDAAIAVIDAGPDAEATLIALCDQDDIWHTDRLQQGIAALETSGAQLVHSDARLVAADGRTVLQDSMFAYERRQRRPGPRDLLYRNTITGMTLLMRSEVARLALPFPNQSGVHFYHDLWLGLIATATGGVHLIDRPLVDYRQHGGNAIGAVDRQTGWLLRGRAHGKRRRLDAMWLRREAASYALARYLAQSLHNRLSDAVSDGRLVHGRAHIGPLRPFLRRLRGAGAHLWDAARLTLTGHLGLSRIAAAFCIVSLGRVSWALREALGPGLSAAINSFDTRLWSLAPGMAPTPPKRAIEAIRRPMPHTNLTDRRKRPRWAPTFTHPVPALTILVPTLNPTEIFAGIVTAFDIGLGLAERGFHVRFIATDLPLSSPTASRNFLLRRLSKSAPPGTASRVSLNCGVQNKSLPAHRGDIYLATAWWSAHVAHYLISQNRLEQSRFYYLIQDFEPNFYPWGSEFAAALESYEFDFQPIFNTTLLRDYFAAQGFAFATPEALTFHPSIDIDHYATPARESRSGPRRLALYGRPEVARNLYPTAIEALASFVEAEALTPADIELISIGLSHDPVSLPGGLELTSLGKLPWEKYPTYLRGVDVGLSLMHSPHPSHPPIEMAASGVRVVTNSFGPKDLSLLSPAIVSVPARVDSLTTALRQAWAAPPVSASERRIDLGPLGLSQGAMLDQLADDLIRRLPLAGKVA